MADTAYPDTIKPYPYPFTASPSKYPVTVSSCEVMRTHHHLTIGFVFKNIELDPMTSVKISVDLYDAFHNYLTTLDSTINGNYSPGALISVDPYDTPGNKMPVFYAYDSWPSTASAVCYVSSALYANGDVWNAGERPSFDVASHAADNAVKNAGSDTRASIAKDLATQKALGYREALVAPSPENVPDGWKTVHPGMYVFYRTPALHMLTYTSLTGSGGAGPIKSSDLGLGRYSAGVQVTNHHSMTVCGGKTADFLTMDGTFSSGPQTIEAVKVRSGNVSYIAAYARNIDAAPIAAAETALQNVCH